MARGACGARGGSDERFTTVKLGLRKIIQEPYQLILTTVIGEMINMATLQATLISLLASLYFLYLVNTAVDDFNNDFFNSDGDEIIKMCFQGVLRQNYTNDRMFMVPGFRQMVINILGEWFPWPTNRFFGNTFKYLYEQYAKNVQINLKTHCEQRLRKFFKMRCYELNHMCLCGDLELDELFDGDDIKNAINYIYKQEIQRVAMQMPYGNWKYFWRSCIGLEHLTDQMIHTHSTSENSLNSIGSKHCACSLIYSAIFITFTSRLPIYAKVGICSENIRSMCNSQNFQSRLKSPPSQSFRSAHSSADT
ncbi:uncharacterized protein LOC129571964 isoform X2 [Sitodiplosis mosellana]|uniref:uncharacterized protein LOC129571964 isoform X2 n=1 Tax=Sitodiplosis mosellana TaxID=263140 RepID=UPI0024441535|nr:uncharacterized protein LOC129571964 isoform X2 [Sitodiplosis mosellana]